jgi:hypothetical protein
MHIQVGFGRSVQQLQSLPDEKCVGDVIVDGFRNVVFGRSPEAAATENEEREEQRNRDECRHPEPAAVVCVRPEGLIGS